MITNMLSVQHFLARTAFFLVILTCAAWAQLPDGPGKAETEKVCKKCHELSKVTSRHQDADSWGATLDKMVSQGAKATDAELGAIYDYLVKNFPPLPKINVNKATAAELEKELDLPSAQATAIVDHRAKNGDFKSIDDLKKVRGLEAAKIDAKKDRLAF